MAKQVQLRRGTTAELSSVTGAEGEVIVDTTKDTLTLHDNYTTGGIPMLREDLDNMAAASVGIDKISISGGSAYEALKINAAGTALEFGTAGGVLAVHSFKDATVNISTSSTSGYSQGLTFNKQFADSHVLVHGWTPIMGQHSYQGGEFLELDGNRQYDGCNHMSPPPNMADESDGISMSILWSGYWTNSIAAGNTSLSFGWASRDGSAQRLGGIWNPYQRSTRMRDKTTVLFIYEIAPTVSNTLT